jgi:hypothetical protein
MSRRSRIECMKAFFGAKDQLKQDEIAAKTGLALQP